MRAYLLTWNPKHSGTPYLKSRWSTGVTKRIRSGDRIIFLRIGTEPKGVIGIGYVTTGHFQEKHWRDGLRKNANYIKYRLESILPDKPLPIQDLEQRFPSIDWHPQASGTEIHDASILPRLEALWARHSNSAQLNSSSAPLDDEIIAFDGAERRYFVIHRTRERKGRQAKIRASLVDGNGRLRCEVRGCGFDFFETYGEVGKDFAEVHHLQGLARAGKAVNVRLEDLAIVCANCHRMVHRNGKCRSIRNLIQPR